MEKWPLSCLPNRRPCGAEKGAAIYPPFRRGDATAIPVMPGQASIPRRRASRAVAERRGGYLLFGLKTVGGLVTAE